MPTLNLPEATREAIESTISLAACAMREYLLFSVIDQE